MTVATHWQLAADPFAPASRGPFIAVPGHAEAVARLRHVVESGDKLGKLEAPAGLGKSVVLTEALRQLRHPARRIARCTAAIDGAHLYASLAGGLTGRRLGAIARHHAWTALRDAARLAGRQRLSVVLAVDDAHTLAGPADQDDRHRLAALGEITGTPTTVLLAGRPDHLEEATATEADWLLTIRLPALSRDEAEAYLRARLEAAGRIGMVFTPRAVTRLHAIAGGVPRGLDRLASLALAAGAWQGSEAVTPEIVEAVANECRTPLDP